MPGGHSALTFTILPVFLEPFLRRSLVILLQDFPVSGFIWIPITSICRCFWPLPTDSGYAAFVLVFIIPVKMKWLAILDGVFLAISFFQGGLSTKVSIVVALLNFFVYFFSFMHRRFSPKQMHRKYVYHKAVNQGMKSAGPGPSGARREELRLRPDIAVRYVDGQNWMMRRWNSAIAPNVTVIMNIVRIICLPIRMLNRLDFYRRESM